MRIAPHVNNLTARGAYWRHSSRPCGYPPLVANHVVGGIAAHTNCARWYTRENGTYTRTVAYVVSSDSFRSSELVSQCRPQCPRRVEEPCIPISQYVLLTLRYHLLDQKGRQMLDRATDVVISLRRASPRGDPQGPYHGGEYIARRGVAPPQTGDSVVAM